LIFIYHIIPLGGTEGQALVAGNLYVNDAVTAIGYIQTVTAPQLAGKSGLEIILQDARGNEVWRGRYRGNARRDE